jgi:chromosomal replication initiation ATPase DnaA
MALIDRYDRVSEDHKPVNYGLRPDFVQGVYAKRRAEAAKREDAENAAKRKAAALAMQIEAQRLAADAIQAEAEREAEIAGKFAVAKESRMVGTEILRLIESITGIDRNVITGGTKAQKIMRVRWDAICLIKHLRPDYSLPAIGRVMGGRDHTTVLNALGKRGWTGTGWRNGLPELATPELRQLIS